MPHSSRSPMVLRWLVWFVALLACSPPAADPASGPGARNSRASSQPPSSAASFDVSSVVRRARHAFRAIPGGFEGGGATYRARAENGAVSLTPFHRVTETLPARSDAPTTGGGANASFRTRPERRQGSPLALETVSLERGSKRLPTKSTSSRIAEDGALRIDRAGVIEIIRNTDEGIEQSFDLRERPEGEGDFVVRVFPKGQSFRSETSGGLHFVGEKHGLGFRYGHGTWIDAAGRKSHVPARYRAGLIELRVPAAIVDTATYPALLDPIVVPEFALDQSLGISADKYDQVVASNGSGMSFVAWVDWTGFRGTRVSAAGEVLDPAGISICSCAFEYLTIADRGTDWLLAWTDYRETSPPPSLVRAEIYAARVSSSGEVLDPNGFRVSPSNAERYATFPAASHDGTNWFVVWQEALSGSQGDPRVVGARVSASGLVLDTAPLVIGPARGDSDTTTDVAFDGTNWLVVWASEGIRGARVSSGGAVLDTTPILIDDSVGHENYPRVADDGGTSWLVVWEDRRGTSDNLDIYGARVRADGTVRDPAGIRIAGAAADQRYPRVAHDGTNWLVVWEDNDGTQLSTHGTRVDPSGSVLEPQGIPISSEYSVRPALAHDGTNWFCVWQDWRAGADTYGARISSAGTVLDADGLAISTSNSETNAAAALGSEDWLVVWADDRNVGNSRDIYGARVSRAGAVLDAPAFPIAAARGAQDSPAVSFDGNNWLVVWHDSRSQAEYDIYGARVTAGGSVLDPDGIPIATESGDDVQPAVSHDGTNWLVLWTADVISGRRLSAEGVALDTTPIAISGAVHFPSPYDGGVAADVAHNGTNWLVVWHDFPRQGYAGELFAARLSAAGTVLDPSGIEISAAAEGADVPVVSSDGENWLVAWHDRWPNVSDILAARVAADGTALDTEPIRVAASSANESSPALTYDGANWLAVWQNARDRFYTVYGTRISSAGQVLDSAGILLSEESRHHEYPVVAGGLGGTVLVVSESMGSVRGSVFSECTPAAGDDATCDGVDDDCDGSADDDYVSSTTVCGNGACAATGMTSCVSGVVEDSCLPDPTDSDVDGIPDCADACPLEPAHTPDGCPTIGGAGAGGESGQGGLGGAGEAGGAAHAGQPGAGEGNDAGSGGSGTGGSEGGKGATGGNGTGGSEGGKGATGGKGTGGGEGGKGATGGNGTGGGEGGDGAVGGDGAGGESGETGAAGHPGGAGSGGTAPPHDDGCGCRVAGSRRHGAVSWFALAALGLLTRRRRFERLTSARRALRRRNGSTGHGRHSPFRRFPWPS
jgi:hypothetical protein